MLRAIMAALIWLTPTVFDSGTAQAAASRAGLAPAAPLAAPARPRVGRQMAPVIQRRGIASRTAPRFGRRPAFGGFGPGYWPAPVQTVTVLVRERRPAAQRDPFAFENLPVRAGIAPPPAPTPLIYRLDGPRFRERVRVIRIGGSDEGARRRSRYAHAETGALLLTVPGR